MFFLSRNDFIRFCFQPNRLVALCVARLVLVILMPKCNIFAEVRSEDAIWFKSDFIFIVLMVIFGISNGLFSSIGKSLF